MREPLNAPSGERRALRRCRNECYYPGGVLGPIAVRTFTVPLILFYLRENAGKYGREALERLPGRKPINSWKYRRSSSLPVGGSRLFYPKEERPAVCTRRLRLALLALLCATGRT